MTASKSYGSFAPEPYLWIMDDAVYLLDGLSLDELRNHWVDRDLFDRAGGIQERICLVIDEESLHSILNDGPNDVQEFLLQDLKNAKLKGLRRPPLPFIKAVDRNYEPPLDGKVQRYQERPYPGWMRASLVDLGKLYPHGEHMCDQCPVWDPRTVRHLPHFIVVLSATVKLASGGIAFSE